MEDQSNGIKLSGLAGILIVLGFFMPWFKSCGVEASGYDLATNFTGMDDASWIYWASLIGGLVCISMFFFVKSNNAEQLSTSAITRIGAGFFGILPILLTFLGLLKHHDVDKMKIGGWFTLIGYIGVFTSSAMDLKSPNTHLRTSDNIHENRPIKKIGDITYEQILNNDGDSYCSGCHQVSNMRNMLYNRERDQYYHENCVPSELRISNINKDESTLNNPVISTKSSDLPSMGNGTVNIKNSDIEKFLNSINHTMEVYGNKRKISSSINSTVVYAYSENDLKTTVSNIAKNYNISLNWLD